ncbi:MAG TPA: hypothetical protein VLC29_01820 [Rhizomicrobium sp.]|nr:hypothetical protein [Rhizomicrobium sp.]
MARTSQPLADERVTRAHNEKGDSGNDKDEIEHVALRFESDNIAMAA